MRSNVSHRRKSPSGPSLAASCVGNRSRNASRTAEVTASESSRTRNAHNGRVQMRSPSQAMGPKAATARKTTTRTAWPIAPAAMDAIHRTAERSKNRMTVLPGIQRRQAGAGPDAPIDIRLT